MRKFLLSILLVAVLFGCGNRTYTLEGTAQSAEMNGVTIFVSVFDGENWSILGEVPVENQRFVLRGSVEQPKMARLMFHDRERGIRGQKSFILDNARIRFNIKEDMTIIVSGSRDNDLLQDFENELEKVHDSHEKLVVLIADFSKKHVNTLPGTMVFVEAAHILLLDDKIAILNLMNEETKKNARVRAIEEQTEALKKVAPGQQFIDFTLPTPAGEMISLSDVVGQHDYVLLEFWASWCGFCIRLFPELKEFYAAHDRSQLEIFSVSLDTDRAAWENAIATHQLPWVQVSDLTGRGSEVAQQYAVMFIPTKILIDRNGTIIGRNMSIAEMNERMK